LTKQVYYDLINTVIVYDAARKNYMTRLIDIDELANYLKLKKQTIYNWLNQGKFSGIKVGGVWRFDRKEVDSWLKSKRRMTKEPKFGDKQ
jgi:excisionase family DNA binding protein